ncbi:MAG: hypothetical protein LBR32_07480 [Propionibacteriaceae bacterium]|jgi:hypothetical protein|nr:hypothetical protein [Propionibacteriaceae bacterium]
MWQGYVHDPAFAAGAALFAAAFATWLLWALARQARDPGDPALGTGVLWLAALVAVPSDADRVATLVQVFPRPAFVAGLLSAPEAWLWVAAGVCLIVGRRNLARLPWPALALPLLWAACALSTYPTNFTWRILEGVLALLAVLSSPFTAGVLEARLRWLCRAVLVASWLLWVLDESAATWVGQRGVLGFDRFLGVLHHPNYLGAVAAVALVMEASRLGRGRPAAWLWSVLAAASLVASDSVGSEVAACVGLAVLAVAPSAAAKRRGQAVWPVGPDRLAKGRAERPIPWRSPDDLVGLAGRALADPRRMPPGGRPSTSGQARPGLLRLHPVAVVGAALAASAALWVLVNGSARFLNVVTSSRSDIWAVVVQHLWDDGWAGGGVYAMGSPFIADFLPLAAIHAHNQLLESILESGALGLALLVAAVAALLWGALQPGPWRRERLALVVSLLFNCVVEVPLSLPLVGSSFVVIGLTAFVLTPFETAGEPVVRFQTDARRRICFAG